MVWSGKVRSGEARYGMALKKLSWSGRSLASQMLTIAAGPPGLNRFGEVDFFFTGTVRNPVPPHLFCGMVRCGEVR